MRRDLAEFCLRGTFSRGGAFGDLFFDQADKLLVGSEESLAQADWIIDDARNGRIPVPAFAVVENPISPHHEMFRITGGEGCGNRHSFAAGPRTIAIRQISAREACER